MQCREEATNCVSALKPWHDLPILGKDKIVPAVLLHREAKYALVSSFRSVNRSRSVNIQWAPGQEQELESLFGTGSGVVKKRESKKWLRSPLIRNNKVSWTSESNIHKLKWVLFLILDYGSYFFSLFATFLSILFILFLSSLHKHWWTRYVSLGFLLHCLSVSGKLHNLALIVY